MPAYSGGEGGGAQYCFQWGKNKAGEDLYWGKDFPGWDQFRVWLIDRGADPNTWIDAHPSAAACIGASKTAAPPPPPPPPPPPASKEACFEWFGQKWGKDFPGWQAFRKALVAHGDDPDTWIAAHPNAAKCIGATKGSYCFEWFGQKWGKDFPGWQAFRKALVAHGDEPDAWIDSHPNAAKCIGAKRSAPTPEPPPPPSSSGPAPPPPTGPPPSSAPTSRWTAPPFAHKGALVAYGIAQGQWTADELAALLATNGYAWLAFEGYPAANDAYMAAVRNACESRGLAFGIWERADQTSYDHIKGMVDSYSPDFYLADVEGNWNRPENTTIPASFAADFPNLPRAVLIAGMPDAAYCKPWIDADFDCMTQAYSAELGADPAVGVAGRMDNDAYFRGWPRNAVPAPEGWTGHDDGPHTWPVLEIRAEGNPGLAAQLPAVAPWGDNFAVYLAETMNGDDWGSEPNVPAPAGGGPASSSLGEPGQEAGGWNYYFPVPSSASFERLDQGIDYKLTAQAQLVYAISDAEIYAVHRNPSAGPGFGESLYYKLRSDGTEIYVGHARSLFAQGKSVRAGQAVAMTLERPYGNAPRDPYHTEIGLADGTAPKYALSSGDAGGKAFQAWLQRKRLYGPGVAGGPIAPPPPPQKPPAGSGSSGGTVPPLPSSKFVEPPPTVAAWTGFKHKVTRGIPAADRAYSGLLGNPRGWIK